MKTNGSLGSLYCWGYEVPHGFSAPVQIGTDTDWLLTQAGADRCALTTDGSLYCWGRGSIGDGDLWKAEPTLVVASP